MSADTPLSLLEQLQRDPRDEPAGQRFVRIYRPWLQGWLYRLAQLPPDHPDGDDLLQETFRVVLEKLPGFQHNGRTGAFRSWLKQILVFTLRNHQRHRQALTGEAFLSRLHTLEDPDGELSQLWEREHNQFLVQRLLEMARAQFTPYAYSAFEKLALGDGNTAEQVARELQSSPNAVLLAKSRVLRWLRQQGKMLLD